MLLFLTRVVSSAWTSTHIVNAVLDLPEIAKTADAACCTVTHLHKVDTTSLTTFQYE